MTNTENEIAQVFLSGVLYVSLAALAILVIGLVWYQDRRKTAENETDNNRRRTDPPEAVAKVIKERAKSPLQIKAKNPDLKIHESMNFHKFAAACTEPLTDPEACDILDVIIKRCSETRSDCLDNEVPYLSKIPTCIARLLPGLTILVDVDDDNFIGYISPGDGLKSIANDSYWKFQASYKSDRDQSGFYRSGLSITHYVLESIPSGSDNKYLQITPVSVSKSLGGYPPVTAETFGEKLFYKKLEEVRATQYCEHVNLYMLLEMYDLAFWDYTYHPGCDEPSRKNRSTPTSRMALQFPGLVKLERHEYPGFKETGEWCGYVLSDSSDPLKVDLFRNAAAMHIQKIGEPIPEFNENEAILIITPSIRIFDEYCRTPHEIYQTVESEEIAAMYRPVHIEVRALLTNHDEVFKGGECTKEELIFRQINRKLLAIHEMTVCNSHDLPYHEYAAQLKVIETTVNRVQERRKRMKKAASALRQHDKVSNQSHPLPRKLL